MVKVVAVWLVPLAEGSHHHNSTLYSLSLVNEQYHWLSFSSLHSLSYKIFCWILLVLVFQLHNAINYVKSFTVAQQLKAIINLFAESG